MWQAFVNAAASGSRASYLTRDDLPHPITTYPKYLAQLDYTNADVQYLSQWWRNDPGYPPMQGMTLIEKLEPSYADLVSAFQDAEAWLVDIANNEPSFDKGGLVFSFSGHGRKGDGTLLLRDSTFFSADDFLEQVVRIHRATGSDRVTRVVLLLDSCYSGAFMIHALHRILNEPDLGLDCEYMLASSHPDEVSWEAASLGHGLSTYCFSLREASIGSEIGIAGLNGIKTWSTYAGPQGCAIATAAAQNPIVCDRGYTLQTCFQLIETAGKSEEDLLQTLKAVRDDLYERFGPFRKIQKSGSSVDPSDEDVDRGLAEQLEFSKSLKEDEQSTADRADALRAFRRAWWINA